MKILVIDDNRLLATILADHLAARGHEVCAAFDGYLAEVFCDRDVYHLLVVDLVLPKVDGVDLLQRLREKNHLCDAIVITGFPELATEESETAQGPRCGRRHSKAVLVLGRLMRNWCSVSASRRSTFSHRRTRRVDCREAGAANTLRDLRGLFCLGSHCPDVQAPGGVGAPTQQVGLRITPLLEAGTPAEVRLAGQQHLLKALRAAEQVATLEQLQQRRGLQLVGLMHLAPW